MRALVATASLELGIDVGTVDLVCQVGSPRSISVAVQRIGRSGHWRGAVPKGRLFATTLDDLAECAAIVLAIRAGDLDQLAIPDAPLDILAQQLVAMCAVEPWEEDALFARVTGAFPYRDFPRAAFDEILEMLSNGIAARRGRYAAYLHRDRVNHRVSGRRGARLAAITSGGAIPDTGLYTVVSHPEGTVVGTVDEDFAVESLAGDIMLLGNTSWRIRRVTSAGRVIVEDAHGAAPNIPFWRGEAPARTAALSEHVSLVRTTIDRLAPEAATPARAGTAAAIAWLTGACGLTEAGAEQLAGYVVAGRAILGAVPSMDTVVAERFFDEGGGMQLVIHAPFGARINKAWGLALRKRFCRSFNFELQAAATDNGINISLAEQHSFPLAEVFGFLRPATAREVLEQAALASPIFATRWRWDASRALALLRFRNGKKTPIQILRMQSDDLLASVFPDVAACQENIDGDIQIPDHPLVREVMKDVLTEAMDLDGFLDVLERLGDGRLRHVAVDTPTPSPFSHEILNANPYAFLDDAPLEERRARAVEMRRSLPEALLSEVGQLDPEAVREVSDQAWPDVRHAHDLHDALLTLTIFPETGGNSCPDLASAPGAPDLLQRVLRARIAWAEWFAELRAGRRATRGTADGRTYWVATERRQTFASLFPSAVFDDAAPPMPGAPPDADPAVVVVQGWLSHSGPTRIGELAQVTGLTPDVVEGAVLRLEAGGWALRGRFLPRGSGASAILSAMPHGHAHGHDRREGLALPRDCDWCERRLLARIHRLTIGALRREIAPVPPSLFMAWLLRWQHVAPGTAVAGETGTLEILRQLQGFEAPANAWERQILAARIQRYDSADLDRLCLSGDVGWGRLSPHPAMADAAGRAGRRIVPTSVAPITFFVRDDADWLTTRAAGADEDAAPPGLSASARNVLEFLRTRGASFFPDIARGAGRLKSEVETALWELVTAGLVTADGFDSLRALIDPRRRAGHGGGRTTRPRHGSGRWSVLHGGTGLDRAGVAESACWMLLRRYGIVFRELLARESNLPPWRDLLVAFRRLEDRGDIRGGRFVDGFIGEQFAQPIAVESLRAARQLQAGDDDIVDGAGRRPAQSRRHTRAGRTDIGHVGKDRCGSRMASPSPAASRVPCDCSSAPIACRRATRFAGRSTFLPERVDHRGDHLEQVADNAVVRNFEDRRISIRVDRDDRVRPLHAHDVLNRAGDPECEVELRRHRLSRTADLAIHRKPSGVANRTRCRQFRAKRIGQLPGDRQAILILDTAANRNNSLRVHEIHGSAAFAHGKLWPCPDGRPSDGAGDNANRGEVPVTGGLGCDERRRSGR